MRFAHSRFSTLGEETGDRGRRTNPNPFQPPTAAFPPGAATRCWRRHGPHGCCDGPAVAGGHAPSFLLGSRAAPHKVRPLPDSADGKME